MALLSDDEELFVLKRVEEVPILFEIVLLDRKYVKPLLIQEHILSLHILFLDVLFLTLLFLIIVDYGAVLVLVWWLNCTRWWDLTLSENLLGALSIFEVEHRLVPSFSCPILLELYIANPSKLIIPNFLHMTHEAFIRVLFLEIESPLNWKLWVLTANDGHDLLLDFSNNRINQRPINLKFSIIVLNNRHDKWIHFKQFLLRKQAVLFHMSPFVVLFEFLVFPLAVNFLDVLLEVRMPLIVDNIQHIFEQYFWKRKLVLNDVINEFVVSAIEIVKHPGMKEFELLNALDSVFPIRWKINPDEIFVA